MTAKFDPKTNHNFSILNENYLRCDPQEGLTVIPKKERFLVQWFFGKVLHWILHFNEHISSVREVFQREVSAGSDVFKTTWKDAATLFANAQYFNTRVIKQHNASWMCSILFWSKVPAINTDQLEKRLKSLLENLKTEVVKCDLKLEIISDQNIMLSNAQRTLEDLKQYPEHTAELKEIEDALKEKIQQFVKVVEDEVERINQKPELSSDDFAIMVQLYLLLEQQANNTRFYTSSKSFLKTLILQNNQKTQYQQVIEEIKKPNTDPIQIAPKIKEILSLKFVCQAHKENLMYDSYLPLWKQRFIDAQKSNAALVHENLNALASTDVKTDLNALAEPETKEFEQLLTTLPPPAVQDVVEAKQHFDEDLKKAQAVVEPARKAYQLLQEAKKKPRMIAQDLADIEAIATSFGEQPYHQELKALIAHYKSEFQRQMQCNETLDAIQAEIKAREAAHDKLGVIDTPSVELDAPNGPDPDNILYKQLVIVRALSACCVAIHSKLNGKPVALLSSKEFFSLSTALKSLPAVDKDIAEKAAPTLAKMHQELMNQIAERKTFQTKFDQLLSQLKEMAAQPQEYKKQLSLYYWIGSKDTPSLSRQFLDLYQHRSKDDKLLLSSAFENCFSSLLQYKNYELMEKCARAWKKAGFPSSMTRNWLN